MTKEQDLSRNASQSLPQPTKGRPKMFQAEGAGGAKMTKPIKNMAMSLADKTKRKLSMK